MTTRTPNENTGSNLEGWKTRTFMIGAVGGLLFGLIAAYMYSRAVEDDLRRGGGRNRVQTGDLIGLLLAGLALVRQVAELGRSPQEGKKR